MRFQILQLDETHETANVKILMHLGIYEYLIFIDFCDLDENSCFQFRKWSVSQLVTKKPEHIFLV